MEIADGVVSGVVSRAPRSSVRILLINPRFPESFWSFRWAVERILPNTRAINPPLGLATLAALCPPDWEVEIIDENIDPVPLVPAADIVGVCGMGVQFPRQQELLEYYREKGYYVVAGGSYASLCPERLEALADTVVAGEAEYIWPQFCRDFARGKPGRLYQERDVVDLHDSPTPRFDLLKLDQYDTVSLQFSRGCPYRCEFCDIIVMFGRRPRTKPLEHIGRELDALRARNVHSVFFVDDNLIGHKAKAKELLRYLAWYQAAHRYVFKFGTEVSLNLAEDPELLQLCREANFAWVFIGIESPDEASLKETKKTQNTRQDILGAVRTIYGHGIDVLAGFIVGFDNDTLETFDRQYRFITASGILVAMVGLLAALPKTPLYKRLEREGRLLPDTLHSDNTRPATNFLPKGMDYEAMVRAYEALSEALVSDRNIAERIRNKLKYLRHPVALPNYTPREQMVILGRFIVRGLLPGGPRRWYHWVRSLTVTAPRNWPLAISDWIAGLAMQSYVARHFAANPVRDRKLGQATLDYIHRRFESCLHSRTLEVSLAGSGARAHLAITLRGVVDHRFYRRTARQLDKLLKHSAVTLSLRIEELSTSQQAHLLALLRRLKRYGDRVSLKLDPKSIHLLPVDFHVFHLVLKEGSPG